MQRWSARAAEALWLAAAVATPLVFNPAGQNGFELPKTALLVALTLLLSLTALVRVAERRSGAPVPAFILWPARAFGAALLLATAFSINPRTSLWGSYERQQGLLTLAAYIALFLLTASGLRTRVQVEQLWEALVWSSAPVVAYGLLQAAGLDPLDWQTDAASPVLSTIGRSNFLGSYLVLLIPLTLAKSLTAKRRWPYIPLLASQLVCLVLTQARGAWVGLGAAAAVFGLAWAAATRNKRLAVSVAVGTALILIFVALLNLPAGPLSTLAELPGLERLATLARTDAGSTAARMTIWRATLPLIAERPLLGHGLDTMRSVFAQVFPPQLVYYQGRQFTVDRAHNLWLDLLVSTGLVGTLAFAALLLGFGWLIWRGLRSADAPWERTVFSALTASCAGHVIDLQFGFDLTASATAFWLVLALGTALSRGISDPLPDEGVEPANLLPYLPPALTVIALIWLICLRPLLADSAYWRSQQGTLDPGERVMAGQQAVRLWSLEPEYRLGLAWLLFQSGSPIAAEEQLLAAEQLAPGDPRMLTAQGDLYATWGQIEPQRYAQAEQAYRRSIELAPNLAQNHAALGVTLARQGRVEEGVLALERAVDLDATYGLAYGYLSELYTVLGQDSRASWAARQAARWSAED